MTNQSLPTLSHIYKLRPLFLTSITNLQVLRFSLPHSNKHTKPSACLFCLAAMITQLLRSSAALKLSRRAKEHAGRTLHLKWMRKYERVYESREEVEGRFQTFKKKNLQMLIALKGNRSYELELNEFAKICPTRSVMQPFT
uniref:Cathepsin propeptide inhibitor domain-containing protein n=1 Tax=Kalanchoe fedtschenkoi TaxID=63787 RepID=A0A7N0U2Q7_KALFE